MRWVSDCPDCPTSKWRLNHFMAFGQSQFWPLMITGGWFPGHSLKGHGQLHIYTCVMTKVTSLPVFEPQACKGILKPILKPNGRPNQQPTLKPQLWLPYLSLEHCKLYEWVCRDGTMLRAYTMTLTLNLTHEPEPDLIYLKCDIYQTLTLNVLDLELEFDTWTWTRPNYLKCDI